jgi:hypothetical protein
MGTQHWFNLKDNSGTVPFFNIIYQVVFFTLAVWSSLFIIARAAISIRAVFVFIFSSQQG